MKKIALSLLLIFALIFSATSCINTGEPTSNPTVAYEVLNNNTPYFTESEITTKSYEFYSELDSLDRCGVVMACVGRDLMPTDERGSISSVTPSGWVQAKYDTALVDGGYLYNRAHLIGWQLTGENANERNLITGTRYFNVEGMLPFENMVADYIKETGNHVMYRVTPDFQGNNLVATGVTMEAYSVEDDGDGVQFCVYVYNYQPGIIIDYATGKSRLEGDGTLPPATDSGEDDGLPGDSATYILNTSSKKFHDENCGNGKSTKEENKQIFTGSRDDLITEGYVPAGCCNP